MSRDMLSWPDSVVYASRNRGTLQNAAEAIAWLVQTRKQYMPVQATRTAALYFRLHDTLCVTFVDGEGFIQRESRRLFRDSPLIAACIDARVYCLLNPPAVQSAPRGDVSSYLQSLLHLCVGPLSESMRELTAWDELYVTTMQARDVCSTHLAEIRYVSITLDGRILHFNCCNVLGSRARARGVKSPPASP